MPGDAQSERQKWIMTGWSSLCALLVTSLLFFSIFETRDARSCARAYAVTPTGERLLY